MRWNAPAAGKSIEAKIDIILELLNRQMKMEVEPGVFEVMVASLVKKFEVSGDIKVYYLVYFQRDPWKCLSDCGSGSSSHDQDELV